MTNPRTGEPGLHVDVRRRRRRRAVQRGPPLERPRVVRRRCAGRAGRPTRAAHDLHAPTRPGEILLGFAGANHGRALRGRRARRRRHARDHRHRPRCRVPEPAVARPRRVDVTAGQPIDIRAEFTLAGVESPLAGVLSATIGIAPDDSDPEGLIAARRGRGRGIRHRRRGRRHQLEGRVRGLRPREPRSARPSGRPRPRRRRREPAHDRRSSTPGSPVALPWADDVAAIVLGYFGGQEFGTAIADILTGAIEPGGRLPTTWPATLADVPVTDVTPTDGVLTYDEGIHIGYRAWLKAGRRAGVRLRPRPRLHARGRGTSRRPTTMATPSTVTVTNTGDRAGKQVVQVYAERADSAVERPVRWLVGFAVVRAEAGETVTVVDPDPGPPSRALGRRVGRRARRLHASGRRIRRRPAARRSTGRSTRDPQPALGPRRGPRRRSPRPTIVERLDDMLARRPRPVVPGRRVPRRRARARRRGAGRTWTRDSVMVPYSVTKNTIGLIDRSADRARAARPRRAGRAVLARVRREGQAGRHRAAAAVAPGGPAPGDAVADVGRAARRPRRGRAPRAESRRSGSRAARSATTRSRSATWPPSSSSA